MPFACVSGEDTDVNVAPRSAFPKKVRMVVAVRRRRAQTCACLTQVEPACNVRGIIGQVFLY